MTHEYKLGDRVRHLGQWWTVVRLDIYTGDMLLERSEDWTSELFYTGVKDTDLGSRECVATNDRARVDAGPTWGVP